MLVNGTIIANDIHRLTKERLAYRTPSIALVYVGNDPVIDLYISIKKRAAEKVGAHMHEYRLEASAMHGEVIAAVDQAVSEHDAVIVQLPLPGHLDAEAIVDRVPLSHDIDMLSTAASKSFRNNTTKRMPPVVGAVREVLLHHGIELVDKQVVVLGHGKLVGAPIALWLTREGIEHTVLNEESVGKEATIRNADVLVSGIGKPHIVTPDIIKKGAVLIDAGTSGTGATVRGDFHPDCATQASLMTPVPGGIGPITVAVLLRNLTYES